MNVKYVDRLAHRMFKMCQIFKFIPISQSASQSRLAGSTRQLIKLDLLDWSLHPRGDFAEFGFLLGPAPFWRWPFFDHFLAYVLRRPKTIILPFLGFGLSRGHGLYKIICKFFPDEVYLEGSYSTSYWWVDAGRRAGFPQLRVEGSPEPPSGAHFYLDMKAHVRFSHGATRVGFQMVLSITRCILLYSEIGLISFISTRQGGSFGVHAISWWSHKRWDLMKLINSYVPI